MPHVPRRRRDRPRRHAAALGRHGVRPDGRRVAGRRGLRACIGRSSSRPARRAGCTTSPTSVGDRGIAHLRQRCLRLRRAEPDRDRVARLRGRRSSTRSSPTSGAPCRASRSPPSGPAGRGSTRTTPTRTATPGPVPPSTHPSTTSDDEPVGKLLAPRARPADPGVPGPGRGGRGGAWRAWPTPARSGWPRSTRPG